MATTQFITHTQISPPAAVHRGSGLFNALMIVIIVLAGAFTGGLLLLKKTLEKQVKNAEDGLVALEEKLDIPSITEAKNLQRQIEFGQQALGGHIYASPAINFIEQNLLDTTRISTFQYTGGRISVGATVPGYLTFAEQIKYLRSVGDIESFTFSNPVLTPDGSLSFGLEVLLKDQYLHAKPAVGPSPVGTTSPAILDGEGGL